MGGFQVWLLFIIMLFVSAMGGFQVWLLFISMLFVSAMGGFQVWLLFIIMLFVSAMGSFQVWLLFIIMLFVSAMGGFLGLTIVYTYAASGEVTELPIDTAWSFTNMWSGLGILIGPSFSGN